MKKMLALSLALAAAVSVSACQTPQQQNALVGGAFGAGTGALVGSAVSDGSAGGALAGAAIGAGSGAMIGAAATPPAPLRRPMRALGLRLQRQPHLRGVLLSSGIAAAPLEASSPGKARRKTGVSRRPWSTAMIGHVASPSPTARSRPGFSPRPIAGERRGHGRRTASSCTTPACRRARRRSTCSTTRLRKSRRIISSGRTGGSINSSPRANAPGTPARRSGRARAT